MFPHKIKPTALLFVHGRQVLTICDTGIADVSTRLDDLSNKPNLQRLWSTARYRQILLYTILFLTCIFHCKIEQNAYVYEVVYHVEFTAEVGLHLEQSTGLAVPAWPHKAEHKHVQELVTGVVRIGQSVVAEPGGVYLDVVLVYLVVVVSVFEPLLLDVDLCEVWSPVDVTSLQLKWNINCWLNDMRRMAGRNPSKDQEIMARKHDFDTFTGFYSFV